MPAFEIVRFVKVPDPIVPSKSIFEWTRGTMDHPGLFVDLLARLMAEGDNEDRGPLAGEVRVVLIRPVGTERFAIYLNTGGALVRYGHASGTSIKLARHAPAEIGDIVRDLVSRVLNEAA